MALAPDEPEPEAQQQAADGPAAGAAVQQAAAGMAASSPANSGSGGASAFPSPVRSEGGLGADENAAGNAMPGGGSSGKTFGLGFILPQLFPGSRPATPAAPAVPTPELLEGLGAAVTTAGAAGTARGPSRPPSAQAPAQPQAPAGEAEGGQEEEEEEDVAEALGDPDAGCILGLFPQPVRQAIVEACLASSSSSSSSSSGSSSQLGGTAQRRLVELCVDKGGRRVLWGHCCCTAIVHPMLTVFGAIGVTANACLLCVPNCVVDCSRLQDARWWCATGMAARRTCPSAWRWR